MSEENEVVAVEQEAVNPAVMTTNKVAACAVSLGVAVLDQLVGRDISNCQTQNANELIATTINNELKI